MICIILAASDDVKTKAKMAGFEEVTVLIRHNAVMSTEEEKRKLETEMFKLGPFQFLVSDYWGVCAPD